MKIFIDIGHPAHVHYFRNFINILSDKGDSFLITARNKDVAHKLLNRYNIKYIDRGTGKVGLFRKFIYMFKADFLLYKAAKQFKPDIFMSFSSPYAAHVAYLLNVPHISFTDTEHAVLGNMAFIPFTKKILTPLCFNKDYGKKHIRFDSYMELCYLHPNYFLLQQDFVQSAAHDFACLFAQHAFVQSAAQVTTCLFLQHPFFEQLDAQVPVEHDTIKPKLKTIINKNIFFREKLSERIMFIFSFTNDFFYGNRCPCF